MAIKVHDCCAGLIGVLFVLGVSGGAAFPDAAQEQFKKNDAQAGEGTTAPAVATFTPEQRAHWAFQTVKAPPVPSVTAEGVGTQIDHFILASLELKGLKPTPPADKRTLIRRVTFDLIGLPPTPEEIDAFFADNSPEAFKKVVDRLLDSPHYGERWGRHWLDVVRYAETTASDANAVMRYAYRYRDYVVDAFNRDLPYDQFIVEQLAGDLLPPAPDISLRFRQVIATGFLMLGPKPLSETDGEQVRMEIVDEQIDVTSRAFLGLTVACARCHDHKFDPIPTVDYYGLAGIFRSTDSLLDEKPNRMMFQEWPLFQVPGEKPYMVMAPKEGKPADIQVHLRGSRFNLGEIAPRRFPQVLAGANQQPLETSQNGRLDLARWIACKDNPLTARVMVNRIWQHHFGTGLVATSDNFGVRGELPSHPELLDWLAAQFVERGWSVKAMHRLLLLSSTYQQSSGERRAEGRGPEPASAAQPLNLKHSSGSPLSALRSPLLIDPSNRLLWRMPRRRLEAEELRDTLLAVSGKLDRRGGGSDSGDLLFKDAGSDDPRGFAPNNVGSGHAYYTNSTRRSIYLPVVRNALPDVLALFDMADPNCVTTVRDDTTVPTQSLFLMNNPFVRQQAQHLAQRLLAEEKAGDAARVRRAFALVLNRPPTDQEIGEATNYLGQYASSEPAKKILEVDRILVPWQSYCQALFCFNEFLYVD